MKKFFEKEGIQKIESKDDKTKAAVCERAIRTIKTRLKHYFAAKQTTKWIDVIDKITSAINNTYNRNLGQTPNSINQDNWWSVWKKLYKPKPLKSKTYLKAGHWVRISVVGPQFTNKYAPTFTDEIFRIERVLDTNPPTFLLVDGNHEPIEGHFYREELSLVASNIGRRIEKIVQTRRGKGGHRYKLVKWHNLDDSHNTWIRDD